MFNPLSPRSEASLNVTRPSPAFDLQKPSPVGNETMDNVSIRDSPPSSPFEPIVDQENQSLQDRSSPLKQWSPVKTSASAGLSFTIHEDEPLKESTESNTPPPIKQSSPRKITIPTKSQASSLSEHSPDRQLLRESGQLNRTEQDITVDMNGEDDTYDMRSTVSEDTCFTAFSAVPNADMTLFATLGNRTADNTIRSPTKYTDAARTPRGNVYATPATSHKNNDDFRTSSPTPRRRQQTSGDTTNLLLDFTGQFDAFSKVIGASPTRRDNSPGKTQIEPDLLTFINGRRNPSPSKSKVSTPGGRKSLLNLLDFDLPPQPTPRSVPTITVRELESLKSTYLSEISSLKASLSGREAEVASLKKAVGDAERRVGEALEMVRDERNAREHAEKEKAEWEKKGREVEGLLSSVREEFINGEKEKEDLMSQLEESNRKREEAELKAAQALTRSTVSADASLSPSGTTDESEIARRVALQLDEKMENLARELHAVYKKKHETKVGTLKKTYEARSEKKLAELHQKIDELNKQNEELLAAKDASLSETLPNNIASACMANDMQGQEAQKTEIEEQKATIAGLKEEISSIRQDHERLLQELEAERIEKGELVAAVDEMLALQSEVGAPTAIEDFRKSISRPPSGLKGPGFGGTESKIGRIGSSGLARSTSGSGKSKILSNIERMGQW